MLPPSPLICHPTMMRQSVMSSSEDTLTSMDCKLESMVLEQQSSFAGTYSPRLVQAVENIAPDVCSKPFYFDLFRLMSILYNSNHPTSNNVTCRRPKPLKVKCLRDELHCDGDPFGWTYRVRLASNCFEQNLTATLVEPCADHVSIVPADHSTQQIRIVLRTIRPIVVDEELCFWPSFELNLALNIPFLAPSNIVSDTCYICTACGKCYTQPNPLKVHLKFVCPYSSTVGDTVSNGTATTAMTALLTSSLESNHLHSPNSTQLVSGSSSNVGQALSNKLYRNHSGHHFRHCPASGKNSKHHHSKVRSVKSSSSSSMFDSQTIHRKLHTCSYCGKVYTRKYGLKIHIRTHTGLKPLNCRYCGRSFSDPSNLNKHVRLHTQQLQHHQPNAKLLI